MSPLVFHFFFFFFNDTATTEIYTLSLHDALPICTEVGVGSRRRHPAFPCRLVRWVQDGVRRLDRGDAADRKSTRLNSSHLVISYAVFCLKKKIPADHPQDIFVPLVAISNIETELV